MSTGQMRAPERRLDWSQVQLFLFAAALGCWLPFICAALVGCGEPQDILTWFGVPVVAFLAGNAAWRLHGRGRLTAPVAGIGVTAGSLIALLAPLTPNATEGEMDVVRVTAGLASIMGLLLIALQADRLRHPGLMALTRVRTCGEQLEQNKHVRGDQSLVADAQTRDAPGHDARLKSAEYIAGLIVTSAVLAFFVALTVSEGGDPTGDPTGNVVCTSVTFLLVLVQALLMVALGRANPRAGALAPPLALLAAVAPALIIQSADLSTTPAVTGGVALLTLLAALWYLRVRRRLAVGRKGAAASIMLRREDVARSALGRDMGGLAAVATKPWSPAELWLTSTVVPLLIYGFAFLLVGLLYVATEPGDTLLELAVIEAEVLALWVVFLYLVPRKGLPWSMLGIKPFSLRSLLVIPVTTVVQFWASGVFNSGLLPLLPAVQTYQASIDEYVQPDYVSIALAFFGLVVLAPVGEELLFRGMLFTGFRSYLGPVAAALISALLFSFWHMFPVFFPFSLNLHPTQALNTFLCGLVYAGMRHDSDSIFPSMLAHAAWNLLVLA
jgi:membrane protease YdiL (CAAX protease family)